MKYYFIVYKFQKGALNGKGNLFLETSGLNIRKTEQDICNHHHFNDCCILNFKDIKPWEMAGRLMLLRYFLN